MCKTSPPFHCQNKSHAKPIVKGWKYMLCQLDFLSCNTAIQIYPHLSTGVPVSFSAWILGTFCIFAQNLFLHFHQHLTPIFVFLFNKSYLLFALRYFCPSLKTKYSKSSSSLVSISKWHHFPRFFSHCWIYFAVKWGTPWSNQWCLDYSDDAKGIPWVHEWLI